MNKVKAHLWTLGRWFALPFFGGSAIIGSLLAGGRIGELNTWLGFIAVALLMACGHSQNTYIDWAFGLDAPEEGSVEKDYTGGCGVLSSGILTPKEVILNFIGWGILGLIVCVVIAVRTTPYIFIPIAIGLAIPYLYSRGKFSWYHETALALGVVIASVAGMFAVNPNPAWWKGLIVCLPIAVLLSYCGLALDEYPDAEANLKKGVKSTAYKVWEYGFDLSTYLLIWLATIYAFQVFLTVIGFLKPLTMISFILFPAFMVQAVHLKKAADDLKEGAPIDLFSKVAAVFVLIAVFYPILIIIGQIFG